MTRFASVEALLDDARSRIERLTPVEARERQRHGSQLVDIRPAWQREEDGEIPGALVVERNHLEWRLHPGSGAALALTDRVDEWIVVCTEGYTSSLAAAALCSLGIAAADIDGGLRAWITAGLPVSRTVTAVEDVVPELAVA
ncbi:sulfurtransferase [Aeromicrobium sp. PE09-221]|uniref:rhodanese-like domain-containing protein n=1 Tax=Aeromicrobium sp. PE09-221 TaxID=1898043 RepID=UPI000B3EA252|nr:rhodanese-like domain-containing protein [Aeromicrobium sp. PE09-221]OUZ12724.1 sulfurtransferase [Aeromicrobium sp. PE09-221]